MTIAPSETSPPTRTPDQFLRTSFAGWTQLASTGLSRGIVCEDGYFLEYELDQYQWSGPGPWSVYTCTPEGLDYQRRYTTVKNVDLSLAWTISHSGFEWSNRPGALLWPYRWTDDGRYVYLLPVTIPGGSGFNAEGFFVNVRALFRLDLTNGNFTSILPVTQGWYACSLSPNDRYLAYTEPSERTVVHIRDMGVDEIARVELGGEYELVGAYAWNGESTRVVFAAAAAGWLERGSGVSLFILTVDDPIPAVLSARDPRLLVPLPSCSSEVDGCWVDEDTIRLRSIRYPSEEYWIEWAMHVTSGTIVALTTPTPRP